MRKIQWFISHVCRLGYEAADMLARIVASTNLKEFMQTLSCMRSSCILAFNLFFIINKLYFRKILIKIMCLFIKDTI